MVVDKHTFPELKLWLMTFVADQYKIYEKRMMVFWVIIEVRMKIIIITFNRYMSFLLKLILLNIRI